MLMFRRHRTAPLAGIALCSVLLAACGTGGPPSQSSARDDIRDALVANEAIDIDVDAAAEIADCVSRGLYEAGEFTEEERNETVRATDGDLPDPDLASKAWNLIDGCSDDAGVDLPEPDGLDAGTTRTEG
jgi:hypothetical protein